MNKRHELIAIGALIVGGLVGNAVGRRHDQLDYSVPAGQRKLDDATVRGIQYVCGDPRASYIAWKIAEAQIQMTDPLHKQPHQYVPCVIRVPGWEALIIPHPNDQWWRAPIEPKPPAEAKP